MSEEIFVYYEKRKGNEWIYLPLQETEPQPPFIPEGNLQHPAKIRSNNGLFSILGRRGRYTFFTNTMQAPWPHDMSPEVREIWDAARKGTKSESAVWLNINQVCLEELVNFDWDTEMYDRRRMVFSPAKVVAKEFFEWSLPYLKAQVENPKDLRLIYWFSSSVEKISH